MFLSKAKLTGPSALDRWELLKIDDAVPGHLKSDATRGTGDLKRNRPKDFVSNARLGAGLSTLFIAGLAIALGACSDDTASFYLALLGYVPGLGFLLFLFLRCPAQLTLTDFFAFGSLLGYGVGTVNTLLSYGGNLERMLLVAEEGLPAMNLAILCVEIITAIVLCCHWKDKLTLESLLKGIKMPLKIQLMVTVLGLTLVLSALIGGGLAFGAQAMDESIGRTSVIGFLALEVMSPTCCLCLIFAMQSEKHASKIWFSVCLIILLLAISTQGRRMVSFTALLLFCIWRTCSGPIKNFPRAALLTALSLLAVLAATKFYYAMRLASWAAAGVQLPLWTLVTNATDIFFNSSDYRLDSQVSENVRDRTLVAGYLALILRASPWLGLSHGDVALHGFEMIIPSALNPGKGALIALGSEEDLYHPLLGLPTWDGAASIFTASYVDFGLLGLIIYPLLVLAMLRVFVQLFRKMGGLQGAYGFVAAAFCLVNVESSLVSYLQIVRDSFIAVVLGALLVPIVLFLAAMRPKSDRLPDSQATRKFHARQALTRLLTK